MVFWSGETLSNRLPALVAPFDANQIDCAAYTLRIGGEVYVSPSESEQDPQKITIRRLEAGETFTIPAGQFAFLLTEERVTVPAGKIAFISMKSGIKFRGLVNVSGFHVDPGYSGHLVFAVFNAGPRTIHLKRGDDCFLIWYAELDNPESTMAKSGAGIESLTTDMVTRISGEVMSFEGLKARVADIKTDYDDRIHRIERDNGIIKAIGTILITILITAVVVPNVRNIWEGWQASVIEVPPAADQGETQSPSP